MNQEITEITENVSVVDFAGDDKFAAMIARVDLDSQIATARQYPRSVKNAMNNILSLATLDDETATECIYALKRGGKPIRGPSIRLAEIIASQWGNCRDSAMVVSIDRINKLITAEGTFHDLETNRGTRASVQRRISDKGGRIFGDDMIAVTGNAACSIARRNAILNGVPKGVWRRAVDACEQIIRGDASTMVEKREKAIAALAHFNLSPDQIFKIMEVNGLEDLSLDDIATLRVIYVSLKNGEQTVEELLRSVEPDKKQRVTASTATHAAPAIMSADVPTADAKPAAKPAEPDKKPDTASTRTGTTEPKPAEKTADVPVREPATEPAKTAPAQADMLVEFDDRDIIAADLVEAIRAAASSADAERIYLDAESDLEALGDERRAKVEAAYQQATAKFKPKARKAGAA